MVNRLSARPRPGRRALQKVEVKTFSWSSSSESAVVSISQCVTLNNLIVCSKNDELTVLTIPTSTTDGNVLSRNLKLSNRIEKIRVLIETTARSVIAVKTIDGQTKLFQLSKAELSSTEWNFAEINAPSRARTSYSGATEKNSGHFLIVEGFSTEQKLNFRVSTLNEQSLSNPRSYVVELPENMGDIEYLSYSIVKQSQLVTLRMQDGSLLVIKLADNGGKKIDRVGVDP